MYEIVNKEKFLFSRSAMAFLCHSNNFKAKLYCCKITATIKYCPFSRLTDVMRQQTLLFFGRKLEFGFLNPKNDFAFFFTKIQKWIMNPLNPYFGQFFISN